MATTDSNTTQKNGSTSGTATVSSSNELVKHAKETASHVADQAVGLVESQISQQQKKSVGELGNVAKALRGTRSELGENFAGPIVDQAADQIERATKFLESASLGEIVDGVEDFARREPLLFIGGAFAVGMLGARFLKSSSRRNTAESSGVRQPQPMRTAARSRVDVPRPSTGLNDPSSSVR
ncbi:MAG: hypothetical protein ABI183_16375 [Polyangiaceae bacterium]